MDIIERLVSEYAKKIYGFAYSKTHNYHDAQDLSQNILLALCKTDFAVKDIHNMDRYIYVVCQYTWSNFIRENKPYWESLGSSGQMLQLADGDNVEDELIKNETYDCLRREIAYLAERRRQVTLMYYFEGKSGKEISEKLGIPAATVRWHLGKTKKILKERITMTETAYSPKRLTVYFSGNLNNPTLAGLRTDLLVQNICIACREKALSVEEIARALCMSAAYVEDKLRDLLYMNYLEEVGQEKYKTNFFIQDSDFIIAKKRFEAEHLPTVARAVFDAALKYLPKIRNIGFAGSDLDDNYLLWAIVTITAHEYECRNSVENKYDLPMHGDGSRHIIKAMFKDTEVISEHRELDRGLVDYIRYSEGISGAHTGNGSVCVQMFNPPALVSGREAAFSNDIYLLQRVHSLAQKQTVPDEIDKKLIVTCAERGWVTVKDGMPKMNIPYFTSAQHDAFMEIIGNDILAEVEAAVGKLLPKEYFDYIMNYIPDYVPEDAKCFTATHFYHPNAYSYLLLKDGLLKKPVEDQCRGICTVAWEV